MCAYAILLVNPFVDNIYIYIYIERERGVHKRTNAN